MKRTYFFIFLYFIFLFSNIKIYCERINLNLPFDSTSIFYLNPQKDIDSIKKVIEKNEALIEKRLKEGLKDTLTIKKLIETYSDASDINYHKADYFLEQAFKIALETKTTSFITIIYTILGRNYQTKGFYDLALEFFYKAFSTANDSKDKNMIIFTLNDLGNVFFHQGLLDQAQSYYLKGIEIGEKDPDATLYSISVSYNNLGLVQLGRNHLDSALYYFNKALQKRIKTHNQNLIDHSYIYIGRTHYMLGNYDSAYHYFQKVLKSVKSKDEVSFDYIRLFENNKLRTYLELIKIDLSLKNINSALEKCSFIEKHFGQYAFHQEFFEVYKSLMEYLFNNKDYKSAQIFAKKALNKAEEMESLSNVNLIYRKLYEIYTHLNQKEKAYQYLEKYVITLDSLNQQKLLENTLKIRELENTQNYLNKISEIEKEANKKIQQEQMIRYGATIITLITLFILVFLLIRDKKRRELTKKLEELNSTKDKFFSIIAHDLKNPVSAILSITEFITHTPYEKSKEEYNEFSQMLHQSSKQLMALIENLLTWARSQRGTIKYTPENISINEIITINIELLKNTAKEKNIELVFNPKVDDLYGYFDFNTINTVLRNLISNAIKFSNEGGKIIVDYELSDKFIKFSVIDSGVGIPPESIENLFKIDKNITTLGTKGEKGTGLGLVICKEFVESNGGKIWVESKIGVGTTLYFTVPVQIKK